MAKKKTQIVVPKEEPIEKEKKLYLLKIGKEFYRRLQPVPYLDCKVDLKRLKNNLKK